MHAQRLPGDFPAQSASETVRKAVSKQATTGSPATAMLLGAMLHNGTGFSILCAGTKLLQQVVIRNIDEAYACLDLLYADGLGTTLDLEKALELLAEAQGATILMTKGSRDEP